MILLLFIISPLVTALWPLPTHRMGSTEDNRAEVFDVWPDWLGQRVVLLPLGV